jgi:hypothetical protein
MDKATIIQSVGKERYEAASLELRGLATRPDFGSKDAPQGSDLPHEISDDIWDADLPVPQKLALFFAVYDDLPSYGLLMYAKHHYGEWPESERSIFWHNCRSRLLGPYASPISYALWCDFFEDVDTVEESWGALTAAADERLLKVIFPVSGPVPWALKASVFEQWAATPTLHDAIFLGLAGSVFDYFGKVDEPAARRILLSLSVDEGHEAYQTLKRRLGGSP